MIFKMISDMIFRAFFAAMFFQEHFGCRKLSEDPGPRTMTISSGWNKGPIPQATTKPCWMAPESKPCIPAIFHYIPSTFTSYTAQYTFTITRSHVVSSWMISSCFAAILDEFEIGNLRKSRFYSQIDLETSKKTSENPLGWGHSKPEMVKIC